MNATSFLQSTRSLIPVGRRTPSTFSVADATAQALGWFSVALAALEAAAPAQMATRLGLRKEPLLYRYGGREIAAALAGFLGPAMWGRVFGELRDVATLRLGRRAERHTARNISIAVGAVAGIALLDFGIALLRARRMH